MHSEGRYGLERGLVGWWRLKNANEGVNDIIGTNNGTLTNGAAYGTVGGRECTVFDGANDHVPVGAVAAYKLSVFTLSAWLYPAILNNYGVIAATGYVDIGGGVIRNYRFQKQNDGKLNFVYGNGSSVNASISTTATCPTSTWTHCALTFDGSGTVKIYVAGAEDVSQASGGISYDSTYYKFGIGARVFSGGLSGTVDGNLNGSLADVRLYDRALSAAEVARLARIY